VTNVITDYWDVDGTSLHTYATGITTLGGSRSGVPKFRGENTQAAARRGAVHRPKVADSRVITLAMEVTGVDANSPGATPTATQFRANLRALQRLFWRPAAGQFVLTRRWNEGAGQVTAAALGSFEDGLEPTMVGNKMAKTTVDVRLADPFFYTAQQTATLAVGVPQTITNPGDDIVTMMTLEFNASLINPKVTNSTTSPQVWIKYGGTIGSGKITADVEQTTAIKSIDSSSVVGAITHSGARHWLGLARGANTLTLTADSGTGTVTVKYQVPYF
jgi:hypothetical protein